MAVYPGRLRDSTPYGQALKDYIDSIPAEQAADPESALVSALNGQYARTRDVGEVVLPVGSWLTSPSGWVRQSDPANDPDYWEEYAESAPSGDAFWSWSTVDGEWVYTLHAGVGSPWVPVWDDITNLMVAGEVEGQAITSYALTGLVERTAGDANEFWFGALDFDAAPYLGSYLRAGYADLDGGLTPVVPSWFGQGDLEVPVSPDSSKKFAFVAQVADHASSPAVGTTVALSGGLTAIGAWWTTQANASVEAEGYYTHAEGHTTHAEGQYTHAEGQATHAEGQSTHAEGQATHAEGYNTHAFRTSESARGNSNLHHALIPTIVGATTNTGVALSGGTNTGAASFPVHAGVTLVKATISDATAGVVYEIRFAATNNAANFTARGSETVTIGAVAGNTAPILGASAVTWTVAGTSIGRVTITPSATFGGTTRRVWLELLEFGSNTQIKA